jgi:hypothetical protein
MEKAMVQLLAAECRADVNAKANGGETALYRVAKAMDGEMVLLLA